MELEVKRSDQYEKRRIEWLWHPFIQKGAINLLTGGPGTGKSTIACDIAAALSTARPLPGEDPETAKARGIRKTWLFNAEDDPEDTIIWRLDNQQADRSKIWITSIGRPISFDVIGEIRETIKANNIDLLVVDPVQAWIPADTDMHRANQMREWGNLFRGLCADLNVTVLWVRHRRKGDTEDAGSINSGLGSIDMSGIVRSEIGAVATKAGSKIVRIKGSVGQTGLQLTYAIEGTGEAGNDHGRLRWSGEIQKAKITDKPGRNRRDPVTTWLTSTLSNGPLPKKDLIDAAARFGYTEKQLTTASKGLTVKYFDGRTGLWRLRTPADTNEQPDEDI